MNYRKILKTGSIAVLMAAYALLSLSCSNEGALMKVGAPSSGVSSEAKPAVTVNVALVESSIMEDLITLSGEVSATGRVNVVPDTGGLLSRVLVKAGDRISYNQVVAYVDPSRPGMSYTESPVRSKAAGTVTDVPMVAGNQVSTQTVIAQVGDLGNLEIETSVPEKYIGSLENGMAARVTTRAYPDMAIDARIAEVSPVVNPRSRTVAVTLVPESSEFLRPGQSVAINLVLDTRTDALLIPAAALIERRDGPGVFVLDGDTVSWRGVSVGTAGGGFVEILEGLDAGDSVVSAGVDAITHGSTVRILEG